MTSDNATYGGGAWSTHAVYDFGCGVGECSNSSEIRKTTGQKTSPMRASWPLVFRIPCLSLQSASTSINAAGRC
jgi:hypothetical protein